MIRPTFFFLWMLGSPLLLVPTEKSITLPDDNALATLKPGPGVEVVRANCVACHSTDYIVLQPPADAKQWAEEVEKMMKAFGAPLDEEDARVIVRYLSSVYGPHTKTTPIPKSQRPATSHDTRKSGKQ